MPMCSFKLWAEINSPSLSSSRQAFCHSNGKVSMYPHVHCFSPLVMASPELCSGKTHRATRTREVCQRPLSYSQSSVFACSSWDNHREAHDGPCRHVHAQAFLFFTRFRVLPCSQLLRFSFSLYNESWKLHLDVGMFRRTQGATVLQI